MFYFQEIFFKISTFIIKNFKKRFGLGHFCGRKSKISKAKYFLFEYKHLFINPSKQSKTGLKIILEQKY